MPVSRVTADGLADRVAAIYSQVEARLLQMIADRVAAGDAEAPDWMDDKLTELHAFRRRAEQLAAAGHKAASAEVAAATAKAYSRGTAAGNGDLHKIGATTDAPPRQAEAAVQALVASMQERLGALPIVRQATDAYRRVVVRASTGTLTGVSTRLQDAQRAMDELGRDGLTGITDTAGRRWGLRSYVEMATRTTTAQAAVQGHMDRLEDAGVTLFLVSDSPRECERCRPWEGKILSRGPAQAMHRNILTGDLEQVDVAGTVEDATSAGLFHPGCTHNLTGYVHGATKAHTAKQDPKAYEAQQRQRQLEQKVREWKRRELATVTPEAKRAASAKVRAWQAQLRDHVAAHDLPRKRNRESVTAAR